MNNQSHAISFLEARKIAEEAARINLSSFISDSSMDLLRDQYLESDYCWMFFRNPKIIVPPEAALRGEWAYAVSKNGQIRDVPDMSNDPEALDAYVAKMSDYFKSTGK